jgi:hypothetical protein
MQQAALTIVATLLIFPVAAQDRETSILLANSYDLSDDGRTFLLNEAGRADFFMLGELHGEKEIPSLVKSIWPDLYGKGYRNIAAELSEWAAARMELSDEKDPIEPEGLWTSEEARFVHSISTETRVLWGCDMEEISLGDMIADLTATARDNKFSHDILPIISEGYNRKLAPQLLEILNTAGAAEFFGKNDLYQPTILSLRIDSARAFPGSRLKAQLLREDLMKRSFIKNYKLFPRNKVFLRFGRNHLHYGFDERGIPTLGNFISELCVAEDLKCFNVAAFAAGGECRLMGHTFSADERGDDIAFQYLSERSNYGTTIFDLRPLRIYLHGIPTGSRSDLQRRLWYWALSYDAIICFRKVTPR